MKNIALILFSFLLFIQGKAQQVMTLDNAIAIGLKNNYDILMAKNQAAVDSNDYSYAFGAFLPLISGNATKTWSANNTKVKYFGTDTASIRKNARSNNLNASINLDWTLFDGLRMFATRNRLKTIEEAGALTVKTQIINTIANIISAYYNIVQQKEELKSLSDQMDISQQRVQIAQNKFNSGLGSKLDMLQAQVDLNAQRAAYLLQQTNIDKSKAILNQLIALPSDNNYEVEDSIPVNENLNIADFQSSVFTSNPALELASKNIDIAKYSLQEIQRSRFPVISFNSAYSFNRQQNQQQTSKFSPSSNRTSGLQYGFSASIPIFSGFNINREAKDAQLNMMYEQLNYENQKSQVSVTLQNAYKDYTYYLKAVKLEEDNLNIAKENATVALAAFKQGQTTTIDVQTAQQGLADAMFRLISARYNAKLSETALLQLRGDLLK